MTPSGPNNERLNKQLEFIVEIDKAKRVLRRTLLMDGSRNENDAEHSWHLAVMAMLLHEHSDVKDLDLARVIKMVLVHDIVEIDAGDTFAYDPSAQKDQAERERRAADRIFGMLPAEQGAEIRALWEEFEEGKTPEAKFAIALDRLQPFLHNYHTCGGTWKLHQVTKPQVTKRAQPIAEASKSLWEYVQWMIDDAVQQGFLKDSES